MANLERIQVKEELIQMIGWLIGLRWLAVIGLLLTILGSIFLFQITLPFIPLLFITGTLFVCNIIFYICNNNNTKNRDNRYPSIELFANFQISIDLIILSFLIHFAGGIENPFIFYFIFHMIIASILLSQRDSYIQAAMGSTVIFFISISEHLGIIKHYHIDLFITENLSNIRYLLGINIVFVSTLFLSVYMATSITQRLRKREDELFEFKEKLKEKNTELEEAYRQLEIASERKREFMLITAHQLRSPIAAIQGMLKVIFSGYLKGEHEKQKEGYKEM